MTFDPVAYWNQVPPPPAGTTPPHAEQERVLRNVLRGLDFASVLELGCGYGRITSLLATMTSEPITVLDIGVQQVAATTRRVPGSIGIHSSIQDFHTDQRWDLVIATEVLMHVSPEDIAAVCDKLRRLSSRWIVSCDWTEPLATGKTIAAHNWLHDYASLLPPSASVSVGRQTIYTMEVA